jgi:hypothetical protein
MAGWCKVDAREMTRSMAGAPRSQPPRAMSRDWPRRQPTALPGGTRRLAHLAGIC